MLLSVGPVAPIAPIVLPDVLAIPMFLILVKLALILGAIHVLVEPVAVHLTLDELAAEMTAFFPLEDADAVLLVVLPLAGVV